jgi:hypothetical protein
MLQTEKYREQIFELHSQGLTGRDIQHKLGFKNHQPIYHFLKRYNLEYNPIKYRRKYTLNENYFKVIDKEDKAYILGFICADGHVENNRISIELAEKDVEMLYKIRTFLSSNQVISEFVKDNPYKNSNRKLLKMVSIKINSVKLVQPLLKMGIGGKKTYTLNSNITKFIPKYLMKDFLRGYFDGDGNVLFNKKYSSGIKYSINIAGNKEFLMNTFQKEFPSHCKLYKDLHSKQCYAWKLSSKKDVCDFLNYLYYNSNIFLTRKYITYLKSKRGHVKLDKLLENPGEHNQQPIISLNG